MYRTYGSTVFLAKNVSNTGNATTSRLLQKYFAAKSPSFVRNYERYIDATVVKYC
jgi:hypothetical protein